MHTKYKSQKADRKLVGGGRGNAYGQPDLKIFVFLTTSLGRKWKFQVISRISVQPYSNSQVSSKPVGYQASSKIVAIKLIIMIMIITVMIIIMLITIKIRTILRKMSSLDGGSAPQFTTHQSCNPHKCQMKEVRSFLDTSFEFEENYGHVGTG